MIDRIQASRSGRKHGSCDTCKRCGGSLDTRGLDAIMQGAGRRIIPDASPQSRKASTTTITPQGGTEACTDKARAFLAISANSSDGDGQGWPVAV